LFDDRTPTALRNYELILRGEKVPGLRPELPDRFENWRRRIGRARFVPLDITSLRGAIVGDMKLPPKRGHRTRRPCLAPVLEGQGAGERVGLAAGVAQLEAVGVRAL